jgi:hypothetical protein
MGEQQPGVRLVDTQRDLRIGAGESMYLEQPGVRIGGGKSERQREIEAERMQHEREWWRVTAARYTLEKSGVIVDRDPGDEDRS